jgi:hypothetical protein
MQNKKLRVVRVITASYVVPWHLGNTLKRITKDFDICVVGQNVSLYAKDYPGVEWVDIDLNRKARYCAFYYAKSWVINCLGRNCYFCSS